VYYKNSLGKTKIWLVIYGNIEYNTNWEYTYVTWWFNLIQCWLGLLQIITLVVTKYICTLSPRY